MAPLLLGFILGPMLEEHLRRSMLLSRGDPMVFLTHPISAVLLAVSALALATVLLSPALTRKRDEIFQESRGVSGGRRRRSLEPDLPSRLEGDSPLIWSRGAAPYERIAL